MAVKYTYWDKEKTKTKYESHKDENGNLHRTDGPAWTYYREDGSVERETYWINDHFFSKEEWETHPLVIAALVTKNVRV